MSIVPRSSTRTAVRRQGAPAGVSEVEYRKALHAVKRSGDAASLQNDIAARYNLPGAHIVTQIDRRTQKTKSKDEASKQRCECCGASNEKSSSVCFQCGYFIHCVRQPILSLAQKRGLTEMPIKSTVVPMNEWQDIECRLKDRHEAYCPICMIGFKDGNEVLLSCSHIFHRACLISFETFMGKKERCCPICRTTNYQKKITNEGSRAFELVCALKLQCLFRGYTVRKEYRSQLRSYYKHNKGNRQQRKKFFEDELTNFADQLSKDVERRDDEVDSIMRSMDSTLLESRQLDAMFDTILAQRRALSVYSHLDGIMGGSSEEDNYFPGLHGLPSRDRLDCDSRSEAKCAGLLNEVAWADILSRAKERGWHECAICMAPNSSSCGFGSGRQCVLLSCSHVFHAQCVENFERFAAESSRSCPVCRSEYERRPIAAEQMRVPGRPISRQLTRDGDHQAAGFQIKDAK